MAQVDLRNNELAIKLVYYGPPLSGKTTNLQQLHARVRDDCRGRLMMLDTRDDRTLFFDLLPIFFRAANLSLRVKVYTVPGQPLHAATRRVVLQGADGVAFVADSAADKADANEAAFGDLRANLARVGLSADDTPVVLQFNKRDLPDAIADDEVDRVAARWALPVVRASAVRGEGVVDTLLALVGRTWDALDAEADLSRRFGLSTGDLVAELGENVLGVREGA